jgi:transcriptional regulator with XRE-family HTH domain
MTDTQFRKSFGGRVKAVRKQRGWTQKELAGRLGLHFQLVNKYESGQTLPSPEKLVALAQELEVSLDFLLTGRAHGDQDISDQRILERFQAMNSFSPEDQEAIFRLTL